MLCVTSIERTRQLNYVFERPRQQTFQTELSIQESMHDIQSLPARTVIFRVHASEKNLEYFKYSLQVIKKCQNLCLACNILVQKFRTCS